MAKKTSSVYTVGAIVGVICILIALCGFAGIADGTSLIK